jgi:hypothetical protein
MSTERLKMLYGFLLLLILASLAITFAIAHVEEKTSYGLMPIIVALATLSGGFAQWAFGSSGSDKPKD